MSIKDAPRYLEAISERWDEAPGRLPTFDEE
jgi:hypothetical protein